MKLFSLFTHLCDYSIHFIEEIVFDYMVLPQALPEMLCNIGYMYYINFLKFKNLLTLKKSEYKRFM